MHTGLPVKGAQLSTEELHCLKREQNSKVQLCIHIGRPQSERDRAGGALRYKHAKQTRPAPALTTVKAAGTPRAELASPSIAGSPTQLEGQGSMHTLGCPTWTHSKSGDVPGTPGLPKLFNSLGRIAVL